MTSWCHSPSGKVLRPSSPTADTWGLPDPKFSIKFYLLTYLLMDSVGYCRIKCPLETCCQISDIRHLRQYNFWSLRCSCSISCQHCSNYIFILDLSPGFYGLDKDNCKTRWETFKFCNLVQLILEVWRYLKLKSQEISFAIIPSSDLWDFVRFEFKMSFRWIFHITTLGLWTQSMKFKKFYFALIRNKMIQWGKILHMPWQLCCHGMCKILPPYVTKLMLLKCNFMICIISMVCGNACSKAVCSPLS